MNIFYTNKDPIICANDHCITHVNKMIIEYAQIMCTVHDRYGEWFEHSGMCKPTHSNHPSTLWAGNSYENYMYVFKMWCELNRMYQRANKRYNKLFTLYNVISEPIFKFPFSDFSEPPMCMPDNFKNRHSVVKSYRNYLNFKFIDWASRIDKNKIKAKWYDNAIPCWYQHD